MRTVLPCKISLECFNPHNIAGALFALGIYEWARLKLLVYLRAHRGDWSYAVGLA
jgi:hypothetical protein